MLTRLIAVAVSAGALLIAQPLKPAGAISLPGVSGRIDHLAIDADEKRLFAAALGNGTIEVIDLAAGAVAHTIRGLSEPQGLAYAPDVARLFAATGGDGKLRTYDARSWSVLGVADWGGDADNVRYDQKASRVYTGYGSGGIGILDARTGRKLGDIPLGSHPESFQLESSGARIWVNLPPNRIAVLDRDARRVLANWTIRDAAANYPMALDEANHRLFAGCRKPPRIVIFDLNSGRQIGSFSIVGDTDDLFYDAARRRMYVCGGGGELQVFDQKDPDHYTKAQTIETATGARTGLFSPALKRFYVAVPRRGSHPAEIRAYAVE